MNFLCRSKQAFFTNFPYFITNKLHRREIFGSLHHTVFQMENNANKSNGNILSTEKFLFPVCSCNQKTHFPYNHKKRDLLLFLFSCSSLRLLTSPIIVCSSLTLSLSFPFSLLPKFVSKNSLPFLLPCLFSLHWSTNCPHRRYDRFWDGRTQRPDYLLKFPIKHFYPMQHTFWL